MSEAGKVSLPGIDSTRLQSIKDKHLRMDKEIFWNELDVKPGSVHGDRACLLGIIDFYQVALEEAQQEVKEWIEEAKQWRDEFIDKNNELAEAQQTIARLTEGIKEIRGKHVYVSGPSVVYEMLGALADENPACPICGSGNTIENPTKTYMRLCVPCDKTFVVGEGAKES
ncbi:hypothetical protein [Paenibacillus sp. P46E]|uniref:hypothetical protein n=1 Tax=Paenibacillus sp. P46E TaxID=1349436 RepID=UPI00093C6C27|nr:hypothetical protein [Paenibacillus sp. P46E]OKP95083.1 hypothetical protein A3849_27775 [Paenibacillus sp. P46E]